MKASHTRRNADRAGERKKTDEIVVFWIVNDSVCAECGEELGSGRFLRLEEDRPLCMECSDLDHLVFLARGDAALTRRASRYSTLRAVVVRFSRTRRRYERCRARTGCHGDRETNGRLAACTKLMHFPAALGHTFSIQNGEDAWVVDRVMKEAENAGAIIV